MKYFSVVVLVKRHLDGRWNSVSRYLLKKCISESPFCIFKAGLPKGSICSQWIRLSLCSRILELLWVYLSFILSCQNPVLAKNKEAKVFYHFPFSVFIPWLSPARGLDCCWERALTIKFSMFEFSKVVTSVFPTSSFILTTLNAFDLKIVNGWKANECWVLVEEFPKAYYSNTRPVNAPSRSCVPKSRFVSYSCFFVVLFRYLSWALLFFSLSFPESVWSVWWFRAFMSCADLFLCFFEF